METKKGYRRLISLLLVACLAIGCRGYDRISVLLPKDGVLPVAKRAVVLHQGDDECYLADVKLVNWRIEATAQSVPAGSGPEKDEVLHIYLSPSVKVLEFPTLGSQPMTVSIPYDAIEKVEYFEVNTGKTVVYSALAAAAIVGIAILAAFLILAAVYSCPYIYTFDGDTYEFEGAIYAGAIFPSLERHDYLLLNNLKPVEGEYRVKLANERPEIQQTNFMELLVIDHPPGVEVLVDKYGVPYTVTDLRSPAEASTLRGENVADMVAFADGVPYMGNVIEEVNDDLDSIILTFDRPRDASRAKLVFQGKNTFWSDFVFNQLCELLGDRYNDWYETQSGDTAEEHERWSLERGIPLAVYVEREGEWVFVDYYNVVGPVGAKRDVLPLDISGIDSEELKVKLEFGWLFWEIDYVALDFSADLPLRVENVPLAAAVNQEGLPVSELLLADDDRYYIQSEIGECSYITFPAPEAIDGMARTTILHSKGRYEVLRNPQGKPDLKHLYSVKKPGKFIEFSKEIFLSIYWDAVASED